MFTRLTILKPGKSFADASRAIGELQSGQLVSLEKIFNVLPADAQKMAAEIRGGADAIQVLSRYLTQAGVGMDALAVRTQGVQGKLNDLKVANEDLALAQAAFAQGPGLALLEEKITILRGATRLLSGDVTAMGQSVHQVLVGNTEDARRLNEELNRTHNIPPPPPPPPGTVVDPEKAAQAEIAASQAAQAAQDAYTRSILEGGTQAEATAARVAALAAATQAVTQATQVETDIEQQRIDALNAAAALSQQAAQASLRYADSLSMVGVQARAAALASEHKGNADQVAAVDAQTHAVAQQKLADAAQHAAGLLLLNGQQGANMAALLASSSSQVDVLTAAYYRLAVAQQVAQVKDPLKGVTEDRLTRDTPADRALVKSNQALEANRKLLASLDDKPKKAKAGVKLSDQQKLNNQLLADQDAADNKSEDAERQHQQRLLEIEADFARKSLEQQRANEVSKRQSQADFYDRLTSSDLNKKKGNAAALKQIDADYQAAFQKSQEIAQSGNAKLAADYLAFKQKQAESELSYQESIAKATADKDKAEIGRLQAIHKLRQDASAEEEKQLLAGGDANVNAKDQALADESDKYASSQDKIALSAERSADRQIAAADRAGKKIDAQALKVDKLGQSYDRIAPGAGQATPASTANGTPAAATTDQAASTPQTPADIVAAINAAKDALVAALSAVERAEKDTSGAVRSLKNSGGIAG